MDERHVPLETDGDQVVQVKNMEDENKYFVKRKDIYNFSCRLSLECSKFSLSCMLGKDGNHVNIKELVDEFVNTLQIYNPKFREIDDEEWDMLPGSDDL